MRPVFRNRLALFALATLVHCDAQSSRLSLTAIATAADSADQDEKQAAALRFGYYKAQAQSFQARFADGATPRLATDSLLNWTIDRSWHGSFFIWTVDDRPVLVGCFLTDSQPADTRRSFAEFHQMTSDKLAPVPFNGLRQYVWRPDAKTCITLPTNRPAAKDSRARLREMRELSRELAVTMFSDDEQSREQLRLLTQPLYRYPERKDGSDGAMFGYVTTRGTDPEFLLSVETAPTTNGQTWVLRPMRSCTRRLELRRDQEQLWSVPKYDNGGDRLEHTEPYVIIPLADHERNDFNALLESVAKGGKVPVVTLPGAPGAAILNNPAAK